MFPPFVTGRDVELLAVGVLCVAAAGGLLLEGSFGPVPPLVFLALAATSFGLAWWDVRLRGGLSIAEEDD